MMPFCTCASRDYKRKRVDDWVQFTHCLKQIIRNGRRRKGITPSIEFHHGWRKYRHNCSDKISQNDLVCGVESMKSVMPEPIPVLVRSHTHAHNVYVLIFGTKKTKKKGEGEIFLTSLSLSLSLLGSTVISWSNCQCNAWIVRGRRKRRKIDFGW